MTNLKYTPQDSNKTVKNFERFSMVFVHIQNEFDHFVVHNVQIYKFFCKIGRIQSRILNDFSGSGSTTNANKFCLW